jgi:hypothetical protein
MFFNLVAASITNPTSSHRSVARQVQLRIPRQHRLMISKIPLNLPPVILLAA